jgi:hypothetical protein
MSGAAQGTRGIFDMIGGSFTWTSTTGPVFYVTNSTGVITLNGVEITNSSPTLIKAGADQWGNSGSNGGNVDFTANGQTLVGDAVIDSASTLTLKLKSGSSLTGTVNGAGTAKSVSVSLDSTSTWTVTADSVLTDLSDADTGFANIASQGHSICYKGSVNGATAGSFILTSGGTIHPCAGR